MDALAPGTELFELSLLGGATERQYRALRPHAEQLPWGTLSLEGLSEAQLLQLRRDWTELAAQEYSAAAGFGEVLRLLVRARVPLDLSAVFAPFALDELLHAELCSLMAHELGGATPVLFATDELFPPRAPFDGSPLLEAARAVLGECCVGETLSLGHLVSHATHSAEPLVRAVWDRLARDEAQHANFGWVFLDWALPELTATERDALAASVPHALRGARRLQEKVQLHPPEAFGPLGVFGPLGADAYHARSHALLEQRIGARLREHGLAW